MRDIDRQELMENGRFLACPWWCCRKQTKSFLTSSSGRLAMFGMAKAGSKSLATNDQPSDTRRFKKRILKVKSPASEGKYDASGASTFRATGDHFWIAVALNCKKKCQFFGLTTKILCCYLGYTIRMFGQLVTHRWQQIKQIYRIALIFDNHR